MTFVASFQNFSIELNHSDRGVFTSFRLKTARHELESRQHLYARLIAYLHAYRPGLQFTRGISEPREPSIWYKDELGNVLAWIQIGVPDKRKLELSLKQNAGAEHRVYFYQEGDVERFCHYLRGSKTNWVKDVQFFTLPTELLRTLEEHESSSPSWNVSFIDDRMYMTINDYDLESTISPVDIWSAFQASLSSPTEDIQNRNHPFRE